MGADMTTSSSPVSPQTASAPPGGLAGIVRAWDRFWFRPADPLPLGVIRIFTGLVILYIHLIYSLDLLALVGKDAWVDEKVMERLRKEFPVWAPAYDWTVPTEPYAHGQPIWSVYFHITDPGWIVTMHVTFLLVMVLFTIGFCTRLTAVLTWVGILSYIQRTPTTLFGMDTIMNILVLYLMIGPSGATLSVDRLIARWWARRQGRELSPPQPMVSANFALRLMQIHYCIIYLASGLSKLQGPAWWNGMAVWGTMANYSFAPMTWEPYQEFLKYLSSHRPLWEIITTGGTYFTLVLEISFPFLVWRPKLRWLMIIGAVMLHTGIGLIMGLATFSLCMMCLLLAFVPPQTLHAFVNALQHRGRLLKSRGGNPAAPRHQPALAGRT
jgi:hypothetical protein